MLPCAMLIQQKQIGRRILNENKCLSDRGKHGNQIQAAVFGQQSTDSLAHQDVTVKDQAGQNG